MNPLGEFTKEDWVVVFKLADGGHRRIGVSPEVEELVAINMARTLLTPEQREQVVDVLCDRRHDAVKPLTLKTE